MTPLYLRDTDPLFTTCLSQRGILCLLGFDAVRAGNRAGGRSEKLAPDMRLRMEDLPASSAKFRQPRLQRRGR